MNWLAIDESFLFFSISIAGGFDAGNLAALESYPSHQFVGSEVKQHFDDAHFCTSAVSVAAGVVRESAAVLVRVVVSNDGAQIHDGDRFSANRGYLCCQHPILDQFITAAQGV